MDITVGVLALQGAFNEHTQLLRQASAILASQQNIPSHSFTFTFLEVRTAAALAQCDALIIPGGESTAISLVAQRSNLLEPLREFVRLSHKPTWGTCAGLILLSAAANRTKKGGQDLIGGLSVRVNRNHFGRQIESFQADLDLPFLYAASVSSGVDEEEVNGVGRDGGEKVPFKGIFIRAPIVEKLLPIQPIGSQAVEKGSEGDETVLAPPVSKDVISSPQPAAVEILARLPGRTRTAAAAGIWKEGVNGKSMNAEAGDIIAVRQGNIFGTSFHPELTGDPRIHVWWLKQVVQAVEAQRLR